MAKKSSDKRSSGKNASMHFLNNIEQFERWRIEHERLQTEEEKLSQISLFSYDDFDYTSFLEPTPWVQPQLTDFSYLIDHAHLKVERDFFYPTIYKVGILLLLFIIIVVNTKMILFWLFGIGALFVLISLLYTIKRRNAALEEELIGAENKITSLHQQEVQSNENAQKDHDMLENKRIQNIEKLLEGNSKMIARRLDEVLPKLGLPFPVEISLNIYANIISILLYLPLKSVIPKQTSSLTSSSRINYEDKPQRQVNKQYLDICAGIIMRLLCTIYGNIPSVEKVYLNCISKEGIQDEYKVTIVATRQEIITASKVSSSLAALKLLNHGFSCDTNLNLQPIEPLYPIEFEDIDLSFIMTRTITMFK